MYLKYCSDTEGAVAEITDKTPCVKISEFIHAVHLCASKIFIFALGCRVHLQNKIIINIGSVQRKKIIC